MSDRQRFIRKIVYACAIAALLLPLSWLSEPATTESDGGLLAQMREKHRLSQSTLGDIDPASETIKLATLGMRGVAANILWEKAHDYRKREDWVGLSATLEQIAKLQPNFISVWVYQGWNLSYNISVEFDDYRDRHPRDQFPERRHAIQAQRAAADVGHRLDHRPKNRTRRRASTVSSAVSRRR